MHEEKVGGYLYATTDTTAAELLAEALNAAENASVSDGSLDIEDAMEYKANDDGYGLITIVDMNGKFEGVINVKDELGNKYVSHQVARGKPVHLWDEGQLDREARRN
jgi:hypothetical protein